MVGRIGAQRARETVVEEIKFDQSLPQLEDDQLVGDFALEFVLDNPNVDYVLVEEFPEYLKTTTTD